STICLCIRVATLCAKCAGLRVMSPCPWLVFHAFITAKTKHNSVQKADQWCLKAISITTSIYYLLVTRQCRLTPTKAAETRSGKLLLVNVFIGCCRMAMARMLYTLKISIARPKTAFAGGATGHLNAIIPGLPATRLFARWLCSRQ